MRKRNQDVVWYQFIGLAHQNSGASRAVKKFEVDSSIFSESLTAALNAKFEKFYRVK